MDFFPAKLQKDLARMYPLCMIVDSSDQSMVLPRTDRDFRWPPGTTMMDDHRIRHMSVVHHKESVAEIRAAVGTTVTQRTVRNRLLQGQIRARHPVACIPLTPSHCWSHCCCQWFQARAY
ncbi:uncharacterized protein TNCV_3487321 [Trichonephila clavipes]|nr:uncharacterized protein TNCV_3487321 [Trichonephila clavipes]